MDNDTASESNKPANEENKNSAKISDDELILRRKRQNAERVRACRERKNALVILLFLLFGFFCAVSHSQQDISIEENEVQVDENITKTEPYRIPNIFKPLHYDLFLKFDLDEDTFQGNVTIELFIREPTSSIILHSRNISVLSVKLRTSHSITVIPVSSYDVDSLNEFLIVKPVRTLLPKFYSLSLEFTSENYYIGTAYKANGLYKANYSSDESSENKTIIVALFEPNEARSVFPCFDEPGLKAAYTITIQHSKWEGYHALSNMDIENVHETDKYRITKFKRSPPMSAYVLGMVVSDLEYRSTFVNQTEFGETFEMRIYGREHILNFTGFQLDLAKKAAEYLIEYTKIPYTMPKLDWVAVPVLFYPGALENWGLISVVDHDLHTNGSFNDVSVDSIVTICHELAHMWIGNLVTAKWWSDLWLTEGLTTFLSKKTAKNIAPEWKKIEYDFYRNTDRSMEHDQLEEKSIVREVNYTDSIEDLFNSMTYDKGCKIFEMLESVIGEETFQKALSSYIDEHKFSSVETADFMQKLKEVWPDGKVESFLDSWIRQGGFPLISLQKTTGGTYKITQEPFGLNISNDSTWTIPITYITNIDSSPKTIWFEKEANEVVLDLPGVDWVKLNKDRIGYYRVNYSEDMWLKFANILKENLTERETLDVYDRLSLMEDAYEIGQSTDLSEDVLYDFLPSLAEEVDLRVWYWAVPVLQTMQNLFFGEDLVGFNRFAAELLRKIFLRTDWNFDLRKMESRLNYTIYELSCNFGVEECVKEAKNRFNECLETSCDISGLPLYVTEAAMRDCENESTWQMIWNIFDEKPHRVLYLTLLNTKNRTLSEKVLTRGKEFKGIVTYTVNEGFRRISNAQPDFARQYIEENWSKLIKGSPKSKLDGRLNTGTVDYHLLEDIVLKKINEVSTDSGENEQMEVLENLLIKCRENIAAVEPAREWLKKNKYL